MATIEQNLVQQRIPRSRSARLADQAATAALYVTHPERSLSLRQPPSESDPATSKAAGFGIRLSDASAAAALIAHAKKQEPGTRHTASVSRAADRRRTESPIQEGYPYQAAMYAIKDQKPVATYNRKRAESAPSEAARASASARASIVATEGASDPFEDLDRSMRASRIQNAHLNRKLFTATPPVAPELEEHRRKSILEAASLSMARDMYGAMEAKESGLQRSSTTRSRRSGSVSQRESATLQQASTLMLSQAINLQDVAEKRAAEKLAGLEDEAAAYRSYYGVEPQVTRSSLIIRRRRGSNETEQFDQEKSKEIRTQMSTLRSKLNAVDEKRNEKRENDRASLLELARKNVDAAIQDMDKRLYSGEADQSVALQKYLDEKAAERAQKGIQDIDAQYMLANKVNIGGRRYVEMSEVEDLARSRLQPTLDEINDMAETQRARDLEARLDEERRQRLAAIEREREADIRAEQERHEELLKQDQKTKEEKAWPWKRKSKQLTPEYGVEATTEQTTEQRADGAVVPAEVTQPQLEETASEDSVLRRESKFKNWFKDKLGRRSSGPSKETNGTQELASSISGPTDNEIEEPERTKAPQEPDTSRPATAGTQVQRAEETESDQDQPRAAPLRSNPVTAEDLNRRAESASDDTWKTPSESLTTEGDSKEVSENSKQQPKKGDSIHEPPAPSIEKVKEEEEEEDRSAEPLPAPPSMGDVVNKRRASVNSAVRESRFSEDL
ncbi:uncharacterized protein DSM5745_11518 [Aspergillus mulundensis]|uniref:Eisosome protein 1 n=1 Tax=Aspergillus mulundensis TaxID=1810919 RepID=A0A3D8Q7M9_9EURO|nr:Uncharacterized protein DSM5745_11518 [Aspergillus mulundensis]RDW57434.1 Uncharacterized protein DSM5745_11518 [Aspergillus mulundensis]